MWLPLPFRLWLTLSVELLTYRIEGILQIFCGFLDVGHIFRLRSLLEVTDLGFDGAAFRRGDFIAQFLQRLFGLIGLGCLHCS